MNPLVLGNKFVILDAYTPNAQDIFSSVILIWK